MAETATFRASVGILVLTCFSFVVIVQGAVPKLSDGADQCFKQFIQGSMRRVKLAHCSATGILYVYYISLLFAC